MAVDALCPQRFVHCHLFIPCHCLFVAGRAFQADMFSCKRKSRLRSMIKYETGPSAFLMATLAIGSPVLGKLFPVRIQMASLARARRAGVSFAFRCARSGNGVTFSARSLCVQTAKGERCRFVCKGYGLPICRRVTRFTSVRHVSVKLSAMGIIVTRLAL